MHKFTKSRKVLIITIGVLVAIGAAIGVLFLLKTLKPHEADKESLPVSEQLKQQAESADKAAQEASNSGDTKKAEQLYSEAAEAYSKAEQKDQANTSERNAALMESINANNAIPVEERKPDISPTTE